MKLRLNLSSDALFGFKLVIFKKDEHLLIFLYESQADLLHLGAQDYLYLLRSCLNAGWAEGFALLACSKTTERIFRNASFDEKEAIVKCTVSEDFF